MEKPCIIKIAVSNVRPKNILVIADERAIVGVENINMGGDAHGAYVDIRIRDFTLETVEMAEGRLDSPDSPREV